MLRAGSLLYAIFVTLIVTLLTMSILWGYYFGSIQINQSIIRSNIDNTITSAINKAIVLPDSLPYNKIIETSLFDQPYTVSLERKHWGMYDLISGMVIFKNDTIQQNAFVGQYVFGADSLALFICNLGNNIYISGNIIIKGRCKVPDGRFKYAYISNNKKLNTSQIFPKEMEKSSKQLPCIDKKLIDYHKYLFNNSKDIYSKQADLASFLEDKDSVSVSFKEPTLILNCQLPYSVNHKNISGNIIIFSSEQIILNANSTLNDVIIYAPSIILKDSTKGNLQLFASDSISIGKNCTLNYPTTVNVFSANVGKINIGEASQIKGNLTIYQTDTYNSKSFINIEKDACITGFIYSNGYVQPQGKLYGSLYAQKLSLNTSGGYFENHLLDTEIDFTQLPKAYVSCNLFENKKQRIVAWQY
ncbi:MAG: hypothetical protein JXQ69_08120 [Paludibacteraceae bacterium]|nr:hypothetical protein [Paludibacteraceae bacterium]